MVITPKRFRWVCVALFLAALGVRLVGLSERTLNIDEVRTRSFGLDLSQIDNRPPLSFLLAAVALKIKDSQTMLLLPAALFGAATVGLLGWTGRVAFGWRVGLISALWLLFLPPHIWYSQYARYYSFMIFFSVLSYLYLDLWVRMRRWRYLLLWIPASVLNLLSHFSAVPVIGVQTWLILCVLGIRAIRGKSGTVRIRNRLLLLGAIVVAAAGCWAAYSLAGIDWWVQKFLPEQRELPSAGSDLTWAFWGPYLDTLTGWPKWGLPLALILLVVGAVTAWRRNKIFLFHTVILFFGPIVAVYVVRPSHPFLLRYVSSAIPFYLMMLAAGVVTLWDLAVRLPRDSAAYRRPVQVAVAAIALCAPLLVFRAYARQPMRREFREVARFLEQSVRPRDRILFVDSDDWHEFTAIASPSLIKKCQLWTSWEDVKTNHYPKRVTYPFWVVTGRVHREDYKQIQWARDFLSHQAFHWGYAFYCMKHTEMRLGSSLLAQGRSNMPADVIPQIAATKESYRLSVYVPRSYHYYIMASHDVPGCLVRFDGARPIRWVQPAILPSSERQKTWVAAGRHDLTLLANKGEIAKLKSFLLRMIPACGLSYEINADQADFVRDHRTLDRPANYQGQFGIEMRMWGTLVYPLFVERAGRYMFGVTADNDRPTTNRVSLYQYHKGVKDLVRVRDFYFNKRDNSLETKEGVFRLGRGFQLIGVRNEWYDGVDEVRKGQVADRTKTTFISRISLEALDKPPPVDAR